MKVISLIIVSAVCVGVAGISGCSARKTGGPPAPPVARIEQDKISFATNSPQLEYLTVDRVEERKTVARGLSGRLAWDDDVTARVFPPVSGRLSEIVADLGRTVSAEDVLAKIKSPDFGQAQADARKAVADLNVAARAFDRTRELFEHGAAAQKDVEQAQADYIRATSEKERALASLSLYGGDPAAEVDGIFPLKAPVAGVVVEKSVNPGEEVRSDQVGDKPLFVISDPTRLWLFLDVTEAEASSLSPNQEVLIHVRALPETTFHGRVQVVGEGLDATTRTIKARCLVDNSEKILRAEMYVSAEIDHTASGVDVPTKAVFSKDDDHYVFVEITPGQFQRRAVKLGIESNGRSVITSGLSAGENIVTDGCLLLEAMLEGDNS
jgi:cobalt-zinc-cadmium efflux system membrane fusion protein